MAALKALRAATSVEKVAELTVERERWWWRRRQRRRYKTGDMVDDDVQMREVKFKDSGKTGVCLSCI